MSNQVAVLSLYLRYKQLPSLKSKATVNVASSCILSNGKQGATPPVANTNQIVQNDPSTHFICYLCRHFPYEFILYLKYSLIIDYINYTSYRMMFIL